MAVPHLARRSSALCRLRTSIYVTSGNLAVSPLLGSQPLHSAYIIFSNAHLACESLRTCTVRFSAPLMGSTPVSMELDRSVFNPPGLTTPSVEAWRALPTCGFSPFISSTTNQKRSPQMSDVASHASPTFSVHLTTFSDNRSGGAT